MNVSLLSTGDASSRKIARNSRTAVLCGTFVEIISPWAKAFTIAFEEMRRFCTLFDFFGERSELSRINRSYNEKISVSPEMLDLLIRAQEIFRLTRGSFDHGCGVLFEYWKRRIKARPGDSDAFPNDEAIKRLKAQCGAEYLDIDRERSTVCIRKKGMKIDLSGIAKGYITDRAVRALKKYGIDSCLINSGGDIYCLGQYDGKSWKVGIQDPEEPGRCIRTEYLENAALATSGNYEQFFEYRGTRYSHMIDPVSGYPVTGPVAGVSVVASTLADADAFSTAFFAMGIEKTAEFMREKPGIIKAFIMERNNHGIKTHSFG